MNKTFPAILLSLVCCSSAWARVFNSSLKLKVYARGTSEVPDRVLGFTPSRPGHPVLIPSEQLWYVRPLGSLTSKKLDQLAQLQKKEGVPGLDLSDHWELTNESLKHLKPMMHLTYLDISRTKISDAGLVFLKSHHDLSVLILPETVTDQGLLAIQGLHLREINLDQTRITDEGLKGLAGIASLRSLDLSSTRITDAGVAYLAKLPRLRRLVLGGQVTDASAPHLAGLQSLREIDISQTSIDTKGLAALASLPALKTVYLDKTVTDAGLEALSKSKSLRTLDLTRTAVTDNGMKYLAQVKTLEEVALTQTVVGNACLTSLSELPELRMLELSDTHVTSSGLAPLARLKKLEVISLSWQKLTREDLQGMAKLKQLKAIVLNGVPLSEATMVQLRGIGTPSPWDSIAGLEHAQLHEAKKTDLGALETPLPVSSRTIIPGQLKSPIWVSSPPIKGGLPVTASAPPSGSKKVTPQQNAALKINAPNVSKREELAFVPAKPETIEPRKPLVEVRGKEEVKKPKWFSKEPASRSFAPTGAPSSVKGDQGPLTGAAPVAVLPKKAAEENLLQVITLQSSPAHAGGFSGLSGLRQLRHTETVASLNSITADQSQSLIHSQEDKPENYLGEINASASH